MRGEGVDFLGAENGIIAGMKNPNWEIQNRAVAQPLVVGRMTAMLSGLGRGGVILWGKAASGAAHCFPVACICILTALGGCGGIPHPPTGISAETIFAEQEVQATARVKNLMDNLLFIPDEGVRSWYAAKAAKGGIKNILIVRDFTHIGLTPQDTPCGIDYNGEEIHLAKWTLDGYEGGSKGAFYACLAHEIAHFLHAKSWHCAPFRRANMELAQEFESRFPGFMWEKYGSGFDTPTGVASWDNEIYAKGIGAGECPDD